MGIEVLASVAGGAAQDVPLFSIASLGALLTLTLMEIVLGIDNVVFVAIQVGKLPKEQQAKGRTIGMGLALIFRLALLFCISWVMGLKATLFALPESMQQLLYSHEAGKTGPSGRDLILLAGGLFLIYKASTEIFEKLEGESHAAHGPAGGGASFGSIIIQLILLDIIFSLDSVITAVGMVPRIEIMVTAMIIAVLVMLVSVGAVSDFVQRHPSVKILALSFLNLIGMMLLMEGVGMHVNKGYIYSAMGFSLFVELLNLRYRKKRKPVELHEPTLEDAQK